LLALLALPLSNAQACVFVAYQPHALDAGYADDVVPPNRPEVTYSVVRREIGGGCGDPASSCDGKYADVALEIVSTDDRAPMSRLGYVVRVIAGGDPPRALRPPAASGETPLGIEAPGSVAFGFDYEDDAFDFELEVRVIDLNGNISEPTVVRVIEDDSAACSTSPRFPSWTVVLGALALVLRRRR
jgi:hypothetical protein